MLFQCWASVEDGEPTLKKHGVNFSCLLGSYVTNVSKSTVYIINVQFMVQRQVSFYFLIMLI